MDADLLPRRAGPTPEKITREHQQRLAIIYIRQSISQQVEPGIDQASASAGRQGVPFRLGIDDDLGRSGGSGFSGWRPGTMLAPKGGTSAGIVGACGCESG